MTNYWILSPSGKWHTANAETPYIAVQQIVAYDYGKYPLSEYWRLNPHLVEKKKTKLFKVF